MSATPPVGIGAVLLAGLLLPSASLLPAAPARAATAAAAAAEREWTSGTVLEPESVEEIPAAVVSSAGLTFAIGREPGGDRVIGIFRLPPPDQDFLDEGRPLGIRIDDGPRFEPPRLGGGLKSTTFSLWDGAGEPAVGPLRDLMEARDRIVVQYPLAGGGHKEVAFSAAGAKSAIATVLGVAEEVSPPVRELALARQEAIERCLGEAKPKDRDRCLERLASCAEAATGEDLRSCVASAKK